MAYTINIRKRGLQMPTESNSGQEWLLDLALLLGYGVNATGLCYGITQLVKNRKNAEEYKHILEMARDLYLKNDLFEITGKPPKKKLKAEIRGFLDAIEVLQRPENRPELFSPGAYLTQQGQHARPIVRSTQNAELATVTGVYFYNPTKPELAKPDEKEVYPLKEYFTFIREHLKKLAKTNPDLGIISLSMLSGMHAMSINYDPKSDRWYFVDAGLLVDAKTQGQVDARSPTATELTEGIDNDELLANFVNLGFCSSTDGNPYGVFTTGFSSAEKDQMLVKNSLAELFKTKQWKEMHKITQDKLAIRDTGAEYTLEQAVIRNADIEGHEQIVAFYEKNEKKRGNILIKSKGTGDKETSPLKYALQYDYKGDIVKKILDLNPQSMESALTYAIHFSPVHVVQMLIEKQVATLLAEYNNAKLKSRNFKQIPNMEKESYRIQQIPDFEKVMDIIISKNRLDVLEMLLTKYQDAFWSEDNIAKVVQANNIDLLQLFLKHRQPEPELWTKLLKTIPDMAWNVRLFVMQELKKDMPTLVQTSESYQSSLKILGQAQDAAFEKLMWALYNHPAARESREFKQFKSEEYSPSADSLFKFKNKNGLHNMNDIKRAINHYFKVKNSERFKSPFNDPELEAQLNDFLQDPNMNKVIKPSYEGFVQNKARFQAIMEDATTYINKMNLQSREGQNWLDNLRQLNRIPGLIETNKFLMIADIQSRLNRPELCDLIEYAYTEILEGIADQLALLKKAESVIENLRSDHLDDEADEMEKELLKKREVLQTKESEAEACIEEVRQHAKKLTTSYFQNIQSYEAILKASGHFSVEFNRECSEADKKFDKINVLDEIPLYLKANDIDSALQKVSDLSSNKNKFIELLATYTKIQTELSDRINSLKQAESIIAELRTSNYTKEADIMESNLNKQRNSLQASLDFYKDKMQVISKIQKLDETYIDSIKKYHAIINDSNRYLESLYDPLTKNQSLLVAEQFSQIEQDFTKNLVPFVRANDLEGMLAQFLNSKESIENIKKNVAGIEQGIKQQLKNFAQIDQIIENLRKIGHGQEADVMMEKLKQERESWSEAEKLVKTLIKDMRFTDTIESYLRNEIQQKQTKNEEKSATTEIKATAVPKKKKMSILNRIMNGFAKIKMSFSNLSGQLKKSKKAKAKEAIPAKHIPKPGQAPINDDVLQQPVSSSVMFHAKSIARR